MSDDMKKPLSSDELSRLLSMSKINVNELPEVPINPEGETQLCSECEMTECKNRKNKGSCEVLICSNFVLYIPLKGKIRDKTRQPIVYLFKGKKILPKVILKRKKYKEQKNDAVGNPATFIKEPDHDD